MNVTRIPLPDWAKQQTDDRLDMPLAETDLCVRTVNCLDEQEIFLVRDLLNCTPERLLEIPNFGPKTLESVFDALEKLGYYRSSRRPEGKTQRHGDYPLLGDGDGDKGGPE